MSRRFVIKHRIGLGSYSHGWDDCFLVFTALTKDDFTSIRETTDLTDDEALTVIDDLLASHFVSGKLRATDDEGKESVVDAESSDLRDLPRVMKFGIFTELGNGGAQYRHPKA